MSKPIATDYGWHIIFCEDRRGIAPLDSIRQNIESSMHQGERAELLQDRGLAPFAKRYPAKINATARDSVFAIVTRTGKLTPEVSNLIASYTKIPAITVNGKTVSLGEIGTQMSRSRTSNVESAMELYDLILANQRRSMTRDAAMQWLEKTNLPTATCSTNIATACSILTSAPTKFGTMPTKMLKANKNISNHIATNTFGTHQNTKDT